MPQFKALQDGYLSTSCQFVKAGQVVNFPDGVELPFDPNEKDGWLVPVDREAYQAELPTTGASPQLHNPLKVQAADVPVDRPDYDDNMRHIIASENRVDAERLAGAVANGAVDVGAGMAFTQEPAPAVVVSDAPAIAPPAIPAVVNVTSEPTPTELQGSGNQEVL